ncbi:MAG: NfeD family protein [Planctomycetota bacterium]
MTLAILLLGLGIALVVAEVLFPSFGILSVLATTAIVAAVVLAFREGTDTGIAFLVATAVLVPAAVLAGLRVFPRTPLGRHMVASGLSFRSRSATDERDLTLLGKVGVVESPCRPAGMARIDERRVDVVTRGEFVASGVRVKVIEVRGNRVVVARVPEDGDSPTT